MPTPVYSAVYFILYYDLIASHLFCRSHKEVSLLLILVNKPCYEFILWIAFPSCPLTIKRNDYAFLLCENHYSPKYRTCHEGTVEVNKNCPINNSLHECYSVLGLLVEWFHKQCCIRKLKGCCFKDPVYYRRQFLIWIKTSWWC